MRRAICLIASAALLVVGGLLVAMWVTGSAAWPPGEAEPAPKLGTPPGEVEAAVAKGDAAADLRIGIVGDVQNGISELGALLDSFRGDRIDFLLQLGDAANEGEPVRFAVLRKMFRDHAPGVPVIAVPGNHDIEPDDTTRVWTEWVGPAEWRIDVRGWRILGVDDSAGDVSRASVELLRKAAADAPPSHGTIVLAHRPLSAEKPSEGSERRAKQLAETGLVPTMTFAGHWHANDTYADASGTVHYLLGENCDRTSAGSDPTMSRAVLVLSATSDTHRLEVTRIERHREFRGEFLRLAVGHVYPALRPRPVLAWATIGMAFVAAGLCARAALRRAPPAMG